MIIFDNRYGFFFFKQKTAYEMRISDWSSDVCSSDLRQGRGRVFGEMLDARLNAPRLEQRDDFVGEAGPVALGKQHEGPILVARQRDWPVGRSGPLVGGRDIERLVLDLFEYDVRFARNIAPETDMDHRSAARRVGEECVSTLNTRWASYN